MGQKFTGSSGSENASGAQINPATEEKQDAIIDALGGITSVDLEGKGKITVGLTAVELVFSGKTESVIISSSADNAGLIYLGKSDVTNLGANAFTELDIGQSVVLDYDDAANAIYVVADTADQAIIAGALK